MINWPELFEIQKELDDRIVREKNIEGDTIPWRITAFLVELSEFANEARWFKMWSNNRSPNRMPQIIEDRKGNRISGGYPLLYEFVDALHFAIGIGLELEQPTFAPRKEMKFTCEDPTIVFLNVNELACRIDSSWRDGETEQCVRWWGNMFGYLLALGYHFGLTGEEIEKAYKAKNQTNHLRQDVGY